MLEAGAADHPDLDKWKASYKTSLEGLRDAQDSLGIPFNDAQTKPRGPGLTQAPGVLTNKEYEDQEARESAGNETLNERNIPMFRRGMQFLWQPVSWDDAKGYGSR